jgi:hypothetical protein
MQTFGGIPTLPCRRREFLRIGRGLAAAGLVLPALRATATAAHNEQPPRSGSFGRARSCILVYLLGGPPHQDMFDLKPEAPAEIRGPFQPIATSVPGVEICELLPLLAARADRFALVRSVSHRNSNHTPMIYYTLTGFATEFPDRDNDIRPPQRTDFPHLGAVVSKFKPADTPLPGYIAVPEVAIRSSISGPYKRARTPVRGGSAGFLGPQFEALNVDGVPGTSDAIPATALPPEVSAERFGERSVLLSLLDGGAPRVPATEQLATLRQRAVVLTGALSRREDNPFSLDGEPPELRDRYGRHRFGQSLLLARRLAEAGVPLIAVHFNEMTVCDGWDLHSDNFTALKSELLPMLDQGLSALFDDLAARGLLDETLVVCQGEFGRTPKINKNAGRDHWGDCSTTLLCGGGVQGGRVHGASDRQAAYPVRDAVDPVDIQATLYHCLGLAAEQTMFDLSGRVWPITSGRVIRALV